MKRAYLVAFMLILAINVLACELCYHAGFTAGTTQGYNDGYPQGYKSGSAHAYSYGFWNGKSSFQSTCYFYPFLLLDSTKYEACLIPVKP